MWKSYYIISYVAIKKHSLVVEKRQKTFLTLIISLASSRGPVFSHHTHTFTASES